MAKRETKITPADKVGPWIREDWNSFLALDCELKTPRREFNRLSGLLGLGSAGTPNKPGLLADEGNWFHQPTAQDRQRLVDEAWKARRDHPVYKWLMQEPNFNAAWKVFEQRRKAAKDGKLAEPNVPFVFLHEYVTLAGWTYQTPSTPSGAKSGGYEEHRRAAIKHADKLRALMSDGVSLDDYSDSRRLQDLLQRLSVELRDMKRKKYGGKGAHQRSLLKSFAMVMLVCCDLRSPAVLTHFANMVGLKCEEKKAKRYCDEAASDWLPRKRAALVEALARHPSANST